MRTIPQAAIDLVREFEETHLFAYDDAFYPPKAAVPADQIQGTLTAGTGHTGADVVVGMVVTSEMDAAWLASDLARAGTRIWDQIGAIVDTLTDNQYAALLDFVFNVGANSSWTIWKRLKAKQYDQVPIELMKFVNIKPDGKVIKSAGLVRRRNAEIELWATGEPGTDETPVPSSVTRQPATTPPTPSDPVPPKKSKALWTSAGAAAAGAIPIADQIRHAVDDISQHIAPYAEHSHYVSTAIGGLAAVAAVLAGLGIVFMYIQKRDARN